MRALFVVADFPPTGGVAVLRASKLAKYLPEHGVEVEVLTTLPQPGRKRDESLLREMEHVPVHRINAPFPHRRPLQARASVRAAMEGDSPGIRRTALRWARRVGRAAVDSTAVPDPYVFWALRAARRGRELVAANRFDVVWSTSQPASAHLAARAISRAGGVPWIADYRDPWTWSLMKPKPPLLARIDAILERRLMGEVGAVVTVTRGWAEEFERRYPGLAGRVHVIYNGFDPADIPASDTTRPSRRHQPC